MSVAAIANSVLVFFTFLVSVPAMVAPMTRGWLKFHGYLVVVCAIFTMLIGLTIWFDTLKTRQNLSDIWNVQPNTTQSLLQQRVRPPFFPLSQQQIRGNGRMGEEGMLTRYSSTAAATTTPPPHHSSSPTPPARTPSQPPRISVASPPL